MLLLIRIVYASYACVCVCVSVDLCFRFRILNNNQRQLKPNRIAFRTVPVRCACVKSDWNRESSWIAALSFSLSSFLFVTRQNRCVSFCVCNHRLIIHQLKCCVWVCFYVWLGERAQLVFAFSLPSVAKTVLLYANSCVCVWPAFLSFTLYSFSTFFRSFLRAFLSFLFYVASSVRCYGCCAWQPNHRRRLPYGPNNINLFLNERPVALSPQESHESCCSFISLPFLVFFNATMRVCVWVRSLQANRTMDEHKSNDKIQKQLF